MTEFNQPTKCFTDEDCDYQARTTVSRCQAAYDGLCTLLKARSGLANADELLAQAENARCPVPVFNAVNDELVFEYSRLAMLSELRQTTDSTEADS